MMRQTLLIFAKQPVAGRTKTRLCPPLSHAAAAELYACFLRDTLALARQVPASSRVIVYQPEEAAGYFAALAPDFALLPQQGADLGERMDRCFTTVLGAGPGAAVLIGSDIPTLPVAHVNRAFALLGEHDLVLGPSDDGGYYLIGMRRPHPRLLREVAMSTPEVLRDTLAIAAELGLRAALLPGWYDVDTPADLGRLRAELSAAPLTVAPHTRAWLATFAER
ncbi:MAG: TIGR04282 family arsenosugar biosynthesis glycosyltransferase [Chloroflexaceae bacterium]|nr:TIGR04282 family arsenosugar biosynthesis glycosyltransferase [Chloroflexaceae bacterium]